MARRGCVIDRKRLRLLVILVCSTKQLLEVFACDDPPHGICRNTGSDKASTSVCPTPPHEGSCYIRDIRKQSRAAAHPHTRRTTIKDYTTHFGNFFSTNGGPMNGNFKQLVFVCCRNLGGCSSFLPSFLCPHPPPIRQTNTNTLRNDGRRWRIDRRGQLAEVAVNTHTHNVMDKPAKV